MFEVLFLYNERSRLRGNQPHAELKQDLHTEGHSNYDDMKRRHDKPRGTEKAAQTVHQKVRTGELFTGVVTRYSNSQCKGFYRRLFCLLLQVFAPIG